MSVSLILVVPLLLVVFLLLIVVLSFLAEEYDLLSAGGVDGCGLHKVVVRRLHADGDCEALNYLPSLGA